MNAVFKNRRTLPINHRELKTEAQQRFLDDNQGKENFLDEAYCLNGVIVKRINMADLPVLGQGQGLVKC